MGVADLGDPLPDELRDVDVDVRRDLSGHDHEAGRDQGLARDAPLGIFAEDGVEDGVRDLIGDLVGVALGDRFRREQELARGHEGHRLHRKTAYLMLRKKETSSSCERLTAYSTAERNGARFRFTSGGTDTFASRSTAGTMLWMST